MMSAERGSPTPFQIMVAYLSRVPMMQIAFLALLLAAPADAKVLKWSCTYPTVANPGGVFKNGSLTLSFSVDQEGKKAQVTGNRGTHDVEVFAGADGLTFVDRQKTGAIQVTTIDSAGKSVHSQHTLLKGLLIPSQSYGKCVAE